MSDFVGNMSFLVQRVCFERAGFCSSHDRHLFETFKSLVISLVSLHRQVFLYGKEGRGIFCSINIPKTRPSSLNLMLREGREGEQKTVLYSHRQPAFDDCGKPSPPPFKGVVEKIINVVECIRLELKHPA